MVNYLLLGRILADLSKDESATAAELFRFLLGEELVDSDTEAPARREIYYFYFRPFRRSS